MTLRFAALIINGLVWRGTPFHDLSPTQLRNAMGLIPGFLDIQDPRSAKEQIIESYGFGWYGYDGFKLDHQGRLISHIVDEETQETDPPLEPYVFTKLRDEIIMIYPYAWVAIVQKTIVNGKFEVARLD